MASISLCSGTTVKLGPEEFCARESFSPGLLPTKRQVLEMMIFYLLPTGPTKNLATSTKEEAALAV